MGQLLRWSRGSNTWSTLTGTAILFWFAHRFSTNYFITMIGIRWWRLGSRTTCTFITIYQAHGCWLCSLSKCCSITRRYKKYTEKCKIGSCIKCTSSIHITTTWRGINSHMRLHILFEFYQKKLISLFLDWKSESSHNRSWKLASRYFIEYGCKKSTTSISRPCWWWRWRRLVLNIYKNGSQLRLVRNTSFAQK